MLFIVNPAAQNFLNKKTWETKLKGKLSQMGDYEVIFTEYPGHGKEIAMQTIKDKTHDIIVAAGGDGTVHNVVWGMYESGVPINEFPKLGLLPVGTSNDYCRTNKIPFDLDEALNVIKQENVSNPNTIRARGGEQPEHYNINLGQVGLLSAISYAATIEREKPIFPFNIPPFWQMVKGSPNRYTLIAIKYILWKYNHFESQMTINNEDPRSIFLDVFSFGVGETMALYPFCPQAELYGDEFALTIGTNLSKITKLGLISKIKKRQYEDLELLTAKKVTLETTQLITGDADGEMFADKTKHFEFELMKKQLKVLVP
ncbi:MAG: hypothetical protein INQ03_17000 [Candidatus Heimdallarchaeota archaeon]|nr:hypothetical protein [Candidatus Heimdallarchaeota archaeon]